MDAPCPAQQERPDPIPRVPQNNRTTQMFMQPPSLHPPHPPLGRPRAARSQSVALAATPLVVRRDRDRLTTQSSEATPSATHPTWRINARASTPFISRRRRRQPVRRGHITTLPRYLSPMTTDHVAASSGQPDSTPTPPTKRTRPRASTPDRPSPTRRNLFVADAGNHRVLEFNRPFYRRCRGPRHWSAGFRVSTATTLY